MGNFRKIWDKCKKLGKSFGEIPVSTSGNRNSSRGIHDFSRMQHPLIWKNIYPCVQPQIDYSSQNPFEYQEGVFEVDFSETISSISRSRYKEVSQNDNDEREGDDDEDFEVNVLDVDSDVDADLDYVNVDNIGKRNF